MLQLVHSLRLVDWNRRDWLLIEGKWSCYRFCDLMTPPAPGPKQKRSRINLLRKNGRVTYAATWSLRRLGQKGTIDWWKVLCYRLCKVGLSPFVDWYWNEKWECLFAGKYGLFTDAVDSPDPWFISALITPPTTWTLIFYPLCISTAPPSYSYFHVPESVWSGFCLIN